MKIKKRAIVVIEWEDMTSISNWDKESIIEDTPICCTAVGWLMPAKKGYIALGFMRSDSQRCNDRCVIPRKSIKSIRKLE